MNFQPIDKDLQARLPRPQGAALAIMEACRRDDVNAADIGALVASDPVLCGRLLHTATAAAGADSPVFSAHQAADPLGLASVRGLALCFSLVDGYGDGDCNGFDYATFWSHSLLMGLAARSLGVSLKLGAADALFTAGLLARIGELALATAYPSEYGKLVATKTKGAKLLALEQKFLRTDHLQLAAGLLTQWELADVWVQAVRFHEDPQTNPDASTNASGPVCRLLQFAQRLADFVLAPAQAQAAQVPALTEQASGLGLHFADLGPVVDAIVQEWLLWGQRLPVRTAAVRDFASAVADPTRPDQEVNAAWLKVLIVEDDPIVLGILQEWLGTVCGYTVRVASDGADAMRQAAEFVPHVVLTDWRMPVMDGLELCRSLRNSEWGQSIYIIMLTGADQETELVQAFEAGVDDFLSKPVNMVALRARLKAARRSVRLRDAWEQDHERMSKLAAELALSNRRLQVASMTDPLTELLNRRAGLAALGQAWSACVRHGQPLTLISLDIDHFKNINDMHGHPAGDAVLQHLGRLLQSMACQQDAVCRWGGEEFLIISPQVDCARGASVAERLRVQIAADPVCFGDKRIAVTASFGVASWRADTQSLEQLLKHADEALYRAKKAGRNCVSLSDPG